MSVEHLQKKDMMPAVSATAEEESKLLDATALGKMEDSLRSEDRLIDSMQESTQMAQWMGEFQTPDKATLEATYESSSTAAFGGLSLIESHKGKRKARYMEKAKTQTEACGMVNQTYEDRKKAQEAFLEENKGVKVAKEDVSFLQDWSAYYSVDVLKRIKLGDLGNLFSDDEAKQMHQAQKIAAEILAVDMSVFEYKDDADFLQKFKDQYKRICAFSNSQKIIDLLDTDMPDASLVKLKARVKALNDIREDYENKMQILQSPYYAILLESDIGESYFGTIESEMQGNRASKAYFQAVKKRSQLKFKKGMSAAELEREYLEADPQYASTREVIVREAKFSAFIDRTIHNPEVEGDPVIEELRDKISDFYSYMEMTIPDDQKQAESDVQKVRMKYADVVEGLENYIGALESKKKLSSEDQKNLDDARELLEGYKDEQGLIMEAEEQIGKGKIVGMKGTWKNVLLQVAMSRAVEPIEIEDNAIRHTHFSLVRAQEELLEFQEKEGLVSKEDQTVISAVKDAITDLCSLLDENVRESKNFDSGVDFLTDAYQQVIDSCTAYCAQIKGKESSVKRRRELAEQIITQCKSEQALFQDLTEGETDLAIHEKDGIEVTWAVLLYNIRSIRVDATDPAVKEIGAGSSVVYRVEQEQGPVYIKRSEGLCGNEGSIIDAYATMGDAHTAEVAEAIRKIKDTDSTSIQQYFITVKGYMDLEEKREIERPEGMSQEEYHKYMKRSRRDGVIEYIRKNLNSFDEGFRDYFTSNTEDLMDFLYFYNKKMNEYTVATRSAGIDEEEQPVISDRNVSTSRVAKALKLQDLVAESKTVVMAKGDEVFRANEMEGVETKTMANLEEYCRINGLKLKYSPNVVRQLSSLQILDMICGQVDRHMNNICVFYDESVPGEITVTSIKGIDNDMAFGTMRYDHIEHQDSCLRGLVYRQPDNTFSCTIPYIDKALYDTLVGLDQAGLNALLLDQADIRSDEERKALSHRLVGVISEIRNLVALGMMRPVDTPQEWQFAMDTMAKMKAGEIAYPLAPGYVTRYGVV